MSDATELLKISLSAAVPLWIQELQGFTWAEILKMADEAATIIASQGDTLMYKTKGKTRETFNQLAKGLAALSFAPGGVTFLGMHFEARHAAAEQFSGSAVPRNLTFEKGSLGRFILQHRLRLELSPADPPHDASKWPRGTKHYIVRIIDANEREFSAYFNQGGAIKGEPDIEQVLFTFAYDAASWERSHGSIEQFAEESNLSPGDPEAQFGFAATESTAAGLRVLLGKDGYAELMHIVWPK